MRFLIVSTLLLAAIAAARPTILLPETEVIKQFERRQIGGCKEATLIFCRGTWEPGGNIGMLVGTPFSTAVRSTVGIAKLDVQGVKYDAGIMGYLIGGDPAGATAMAKMVSDTVKKCPKSKIIMGGYSQGAQVAHLAAAKLSAAEKEKVVAVVVFGDPYKGKAISGIPSDRIHTICADADMICYGLPLPIGAHLTYGSDTKNINAAAQFIKQQIAAGGRGGGGDAGAGAGAKGKSGGGGAGAKGKGAGGKGKGGAGESSAAQPSESESGEAKPAEPKPAEGESSGGESTPASVERMTLMEQTVAQLDGVNMEEYQQALKTGMELERQLANLLRLKQLVDGSQGLPA